MERIYKTMRASGYMNIIVGSVMIVAGVVSGVLAIVSGSLLLKRKSDITF